MATPGPNGLNGVNGLNRLNGNHVPPPPPDSLDDEDDAIESLNSIIQRYKDLMRVSTSELKTLVVRETHPQFKSSHTHTHTPGQG